MLLTGVILILAIFAVIGWRKGVIRLVLSLVSMIVTILAAVIIAPLATTAIRNETNIDENIGTGCRRFSQFQGSAAEKRAESFLPPADSFFRSGDDRLCNR